MPSQREEADAHFLSESTAFSVPYSYSSHQAILEETPLLEMSGT